MTGNGRDTGNLFKETYDGVLATLSGEGYELIVSNLGTLTKEEVNALSEDLEGRLLGEGEKKGVVKRVFSILIESLQNVRLHGATSTDGVQHSYFIFSRKDGAYHMAIGNLIRDEVVPKVKTKLDRINAMDKGALKAYYMETLTNGEISSKGGAGLGFITIAMKARNPIEYRFEALESGVKMFLWNTPIAGKKEKE